jgi:hypothetical protein
MWSVRLACAQIEELLPSKKREQPGSVSHSPQNTDAG